MLPPRLLGPWSGHLRSLLAEIRAQLVGAALPDAPADLQEPDRPRLSDDAYLGQRKAELGEEAARAVLAVTAALENGGRIERFFPGLSRAFSAGRGLGSGIELPAGLDRLDRIVVDEVQDLTPVEALVPVLLAKRLAESREDLRVPFLLFAGDEGQTVRATGFEWGWFKNILTSRLGHRPAEATLTANMRCPRRIAGVVNAARDLYDSVTKGSRPRGLAAVEVDDATNDRIFLCQAGPDDAAGTLRYERLEEVIELVQGHPNLCCDLAAYQHLIAADEPFPYWSALKIVEALVAGLGADRIHWGTDWPYLGVQPYPELIRAICQAPFLEDGEAEKILGLNARRFLEA